MISHLVMVMESNQILNMRRDVLTAMRKCHLWLIRFNVNSVMSVARFVLLLIIEESVFNILCCFLANVHKV